MKHLTAPARHAVTTAVVLVAGVVGVASGMPIATRTTAHLLRFAFGDNVHAQAIAQLVLLLIGMGTLGFAVHRALRPLAPAATPLDETAEGVPAA
ncbi:hypothetical protein ACIA8F_31880 [Streptomyces sp. NPDC051563]|uniref:hypothetical protein n=1 Tax=Streptomyces sp. NPDC051563 TaxID=3365659 RepID=UPI0037A1F687